jgi:cardiolipin synthase
MLHAKTAVIDGVWSTIGSTNLDWRSFLHNQEINAVVLGQEFGTRMQEMFEADLAESESITREAWAKRPLGDHVKETAARMWAQWL